MDLYRVTAERDTETANPQFDLRYEPGTMQAREVNILGHFGSCIFWGDML